jgi:hypothetical protein
MWLLGGSTTEAQPRGSLLVPLISSEGVLPRMILSAFLFAIMGGCGDSRGSMGGTQPEQDSPLTVEAEPFLALGVVTGSPEEQFHGVLQIGISQDTLLLVVDAGSRTVRYFRTDGTYLGESGGRGQGPGELLHVTSAWMRANEGVAVLDGAQRRATTYLPDRTFVEGAPPPMDWDDLYLMVHWAGEASGIWVAATDDFVEFPPPGEAVQLVSTVRLSTGGGFLDEPVLPVATVSWYTTQGGRRVRLPLVLSPQHRVRVNRKTAAVLDASRARVSILTGEPGWRHVTLPERCPPVPSAFLRSDAEGDEVRGGIPLPEFRPMLPRCLPPYDEIAVTGDGRVWARETGDFQEQEGAAVWWVIEGSAGPVYRAHLPLGFVPMDGDHEVIYGRWVDSLDVHYVRGYRWSR